MLAGKGTADIFGDSAPESNAILKPFDSGVDPSGMVIERRFAVVIADDVPSPSKDVWEISSKPQLTK